jgi:hypothetical protein
MLRFTGRIDPVAFYMWLKNNAVWSVTYQVVKWAPQSSQEFVHTQEAVNVYVLWSAGKEQQTALHSGTGCVCLEFIASGRYAGESSAVRKLLNKQTYQLIALTERKILHTEESKWVIITFFIIKWGRIASTSIDPLEVPESIIPSLQTVQLTWPSRT